MTLLFILLVLTLSKIIYFIIVGIWEDAAIWFLTRTKISTSKNEFSLFLMSIYCLLELDCLSM